MFLRGFEGFLKGRNAAEQIKENRGVGALARASTAGLKAQLLPHILRQWGIMTCQVYEEDEPTPLKRLFCPKSAGRLVGVIIAPVSAVCLLSERDCAPVVRSGV